MTEQLDIEPILDDWLAEGSDVLPDRSIDAVLRTVRQTTQRGAWRAPWRTENVNGFPRPLALASAAVIAVLVTAGLLTWYGGYHPATIGGPTASPSPTLAAPTPIASAPAAISSPSASFDLSAAGTIVFQQEVAPDDQRAFAISPTGTGRRSLSDASVCCLTLSPDGTMMLLEGDGGPSLFDLSGKKLEGPWDPLPGLDLEPHAWTGFDVALEGWDDSHPNRTGVWLSIDNGGGGLIGDFEQLTTSAPGHHDVPLAFSADGSKLLFVRQSDSDGDLYVVDVDRDALTSPKTSPKPATPIRLNPDGTKVDVDEFFGNGASWSPDGTRVTFSAFDLSSTQNQASVYVIDVAGGPATAMASGTWTTSAHWSPDGRRIAFDRASSRGPHDLFLIDPATGTETNLTADFDPGVCCARWSPDSRYLLAIGTTTDDTHNDLYVIPVDGSAPTQLTHEPGMYRSYAWSQVPSTTP